MTNGPAIVIGRKGSVGAVHLSVSPCWPIDTTYFVDSFGPFDPRFLFHALKALDLAEHESSTAIPGLSRDDAYVLPVVVPPLAEQCRIVAQVQALLAHVNAARERLAKVPAILKRFRQAVLAAACSGRLTEEWREHVQIFETGGMRWGLREPPVEAGELPELPESWVYRTLRHVSARVSVGHVGPTSKYYCSAKEGVPFVRSQNVRPARLDLTQAYYVTRDFHRMLKKSQLRAGDLLVVRVGANRGDTCVVPDGVGDLNCANIVFARPLARVSKWLEAYCQSPDGQHQLEEMTTGSAQGVLNTNAIANLTVPIPSVAEQHEIVRRIDALFKLGDAIERRVAAATVRADKLTQAILAKAFRGELVPTEAELARREGREYEPAGVLLERIRAARGNESRQRKATRRHRVGGRNT